MEMKSLHKSTSTLHHDLIKLITRFLWSNRDVWK